MVSRRHLCLIHAVLQAVGGLAQRLLRASVPGPEARALLVSVCLGGRQIMLTCALWSHVACLRCHQSPICICIQPLLYVDLPTRVGATKCRVIYVCTGRLSVGLMTPLKL